MTTYIDIHVIQTVPPSNLNRDDAGSPKQARYGGVRRARVSSQSWKRATRRHFDETTPAADQATRTRRLQSLVIDRLSERAGLSAEVAGRVADVLLKSQLKLDAGKKEGETEYLMFVGLAQLDRLADAVAPLADALDDLEGKDLETALADVSAQQHLMDGHPIDVALFGRMVADLPQINVDAAVQVAHALSTHPVETEFDYFSAVDDEKARSADEDLGAGMIGTIEFNSATLYRYATVGLHQLEANLGGDREAAIDAAGRFIEGFVRSMPTGKQNSFANRTLPDAVVVAVRSDQPVNLVSAFEAPVRGEGLSQRSLRCLAAEQAAVVQNWGGAPSSIHATYRLNENTPEEVLAQFGESVPFDDLVAAVQADLRAASTNG